MMESQFLGCCFRGETARASSVFPLQLLRNDPESGLASAVIMIEDGQDRKIYSMESDTYLSLWFDNGQKQVSTYWQGNFLNAHIQAEE